MSGTTRREALAGAAGALATAATRSPGDASAELEVLLRAPAAFSVEGPWRLADESAEVAEARRRVPAEQLARLRALPPGPLTPAAALDRDVVTAHWTLQARLGRESPIGAGPGRPYVLDPRTGAHRLAITGLGGPAPTAATADAYLQTLRRLARNADAETERLRADADGFGVVLPSALLARTLASVRAAAATSGEASPLARHAPDPAAAAALVDAELRPPSPGRRLRWRRWLRAPGPAAARRRSATAAATSHCVCGWVQALTSPLTPPRRRRARPRASSPPASTAAYGGAD